MVAGLSIGFIGLVLGMVAGWFGGVVDAIVGRVVDVLLAFPLFLLALGITGLIGPGLRNLTLALISVAWAGYARIVRSAVLAERASSTWRRPGPPAPASSGCCASTSCPTWWRRCWC